MGFKNEFIFLNKKDSNKKENTNNIYRLHYVNYNNKHNEDIIFDTFKYSCEIKEEYVFALISFIKDLVNREYPKYTRLSNKAILIDSLIEYFGFERVTQTIEEEKVTELFLITGIIRKFKESNYYEKYINWYIPNITYEEIILIHKQDKNIKLRKKGKR